MKTKQELLPKVTIDTELSVGYIRFTESKIASRHILDPDETIIVDLDESGDVVGIEIVSLRRLEKMAAAGTSLRREKHKNKAQASVSAITEETLPLFVLPHLISRSACSQVHR